MSRRDDDALWLLALLWLLTRKRVDSGVSLSVTKTSPLAAGERATASSDPVSTPE